MNVDLGLYLGLNLGLYNNNVSCLRTVFGEKKKKQILVNPIILKYQLWE